MAISFNFDVPVGSTAALTAKEVTPLTTPEGVVIATVGPVLAGVMLIEELAATRSLLSLT